MRRRHTLKQEVGIKRLGLEALAKIKINPKEE